MKFPFTRDRATGGLRSTSKSVVEQISEQSTPRRCTECQQPATLWRFRRDVQGAKDKSSRQPVCKNHKDL